MLNLSGPIHSLYLRLPFFLLTDPLDTIKVLLQTQNVTAEQVVAKTVASTAATTTATTAANNNGVVVYRGAWHCFRHTVDTKGFRSLYKGISSPLLGSMAENAVLFLCYSSVKRALGEEPGVKELSLSQLCLSGAIAGGVVSFVLTVRTCKNVDVCILVYRWRGLTGCVSLGCSRANKLSFTLSYILFFALHCALPFLLP